MNGDSPSSRSSVSEEHFSALFNEGGFFERKNSGALDLHGKDALDFLHRMTTNELKSLKPFTVQETILTNEKARIIDVLRVLIGEEYIRVLTSERLNKDVRKWLEKFIIMDDVTIVERTEELALIDVIGEKAISKITAELIGSTEKFESAWRKIQIDSVQAELVFHQSITGSMLTIVFPKAQIDAMKRWLRNIIGISSELTEAQFELWRIEHGFPKVGAELSEYVHPLEAGAERAVSFTKGCYVGQEVIARLDTYQKVHRQLRGIIIDSSEAIAETPPIILKSESREIGKITSLVFHPRLRKWIGLGIVETGMEEATSLHVDCNGKSIDARIVSLPFSISENEAVGG